MSRSDVLVDADWVEAHLDDPGVVLVEVDEDTSAYDKGHIRGAVKIDWKKDLQDPVRRDFVDRRGFEQLLSERGIANDDTVVLYGGNNNWFAAYAYWYFKLYGHQNVKLLDGGRKKWELDSRELVTDGAGAARRRPTSAPEQDALAPRVPRRGHRRDRQAEPGRRPVAGRVHRQLLAPAHLPQEQAQRAGHIPTAKNVPWSKAANDDGTFKSDDELRALYQGEAGLDFGKDTIAYCRIGERSRAHLVRAARAARPAAREELRRVLDRVRLAGRRADRAGRGTMSEAQGCGAPAGRRPRDRRRTGSRP